MNRLISFQKLTEIKIKDDPLNLKGHLLIRQIFARKNIAMFVFMEQ